MIGTNRAGNSFPGLGKKDHDGIFAYIYDVAQGSGVKSNIYFGGNIRVRNNTRSGNGGVNANIPLEIVTADSQYASVAYRPYNMIIEALENSNLTVLIILISSLRKNMTLSRFYSEGYSLQCYGRQ